MTPPRLSEVAAVKPAIDTLQSFNTWISDLVTAALRDSGRHGTQLRSCPPAFGLLLDLTSLSATPS